MHPHTLQIVPKSVRESPTWTALLTASAILAWLAASACISTSSPPLTGLTLSASDGPAPLTVQFSPAETKTDAAFLWNFGDGSVSSDREPEHTYLDAGQFTVQLTVTLGDQSSTRDSQVSVQPGPAGWVVIEPGEVDLVTGQVNRFTATAFDEFGNPVPDANITWKAAPAAGNIDAGGTLTASGRVGEYPLAIEAEFERLGKTGSGSASVNVVLGPLAAIEVEGDGFQIAPGQRAGLMAFARDAVGNPLSEAELEWEAVREVDEIDATGSFKAGLKPTNGSETLVRVTASLDGRSAETEIEGRVLHGVIDRVEVTPSEVVVGLNGVLTLQAKTFDRFDNPVIPDSVDWRLLHTNLGEIDENGLFTAGTVAGEFANGLIVTATKDKVTAASHVRVLIEPDPAVELRIGPDGDSVPAGASSPLSASAVDLHGNRISQPPLEWAATAGGRVTENGVFVAALEPGRFPDAITATLPADSAGNNAELTATMSITVRQRSSDYLALEVRDQDGGAIYLLNLLTASLSPLSEDLLENGARETSPAWTPDGSQLLYSSNISGTDQIYVIDPFTGARARLTDGPDGSVMPDVSPTGMEFAYVVTAEDEWQVYVAPMPQTEIQDIEPVTRDETTRVSNDDSLRYILPHWSPNGQTVAMSAIQEDGSVSVHVSDRDGRNERPIAGSETGELAFGWLTDGSGLLVGVDAGDSGMDLMMVRLDGGPRIPAAELPFTATEAFWAPDQTELAVIDADQGSLWLGDVDGTGLRQLMRAAVLPRHAAWRPVPLEPAQ